MRRFTLAAALLAALTMAGAAHATAVNWVGGTNSDWDLGDNFERLDTNQIGTAVEILGRDDGWEQRNDSALIANPEIVISGSDVDIFVPMVLVGNFHMSSRGGTLPAATNGTSGSLRIEDGARLTIQSGPGGDIDGNWVQWDADDLTITGAGSLFQQTRVADGSGVPYNGGSMNFGSWRGHSTGQAMTLNVLDRGRFSHDGQVLFGAQGDNEIGLVVHGTVGEGATLDFFNGANEAPGLPNNDDSACNGDTNAEPCQASLNFVYGYDVDTATFKGEDYKLDFNAHGGSLTVDHGGIMLLETTGFFYQDSDGDDADTYLAPVKESYQDLYAGITHENTEEPGTFLATKQIIQHNGANTAVFENVFHVTGSPGDDGYRLANIQGAVDGGAQRSDINGDMFVDGADVQILIPNLGTGDGSGTDVFLSQGNIVPDEFIDGLDAQKMLADLNSAYDVDPATVTVGEVQAEYNIVTGNISVSVGENILSWFIESTADQNGIVGGMTGPDDAGDVLPLGGGTYAGNVLRVGETKFSSPLDSYDANLGQIAAPGLDDVLFSFTRGDGSQVNGVLANVVPEPASLMLIGLGLCGVLASRRRLAA